MQIQNRNIAFHKSKIVRLRNDSIEELRKGRVVRSIPFSEVSSVNLAFMGASHAGADPLPAYRCRIKGRRGQSIEFRNVAYVKFSEVASYSPVHLAMVVELHKRLLHYRDKIRFRQGSDAFYWLGWFGLLMSALLVMMVPCLFLLDGGFWMVLRKAWVLALMPILVATCFWPLVKRGRSQPYLPDDLPMDHLPVEHLIEPASERDDA